MQRLSEAVRSIVEKARGIVGRPSAPATDTSGASRNYENEREAHRMGGMSEEDRAWEAASRERSRRTQAGEQAPPARDDESR